MVPLVGVKQRAALGFLLLNANEVVPTSRLLQALWGDRPPATARKILQNAVSGLRRTLVDVELVTRAPGYGLFVGRERVDWFLFQDQAARGRAALATGDLKVATEILGGALDLWRGPLLSDLVEVGIDWPELYPIRYQRLDVLEDYFDARLALGQHFEVVGSLGREVQLEPARERLCGQYMLALYRSGRQVEALAAYRRTRHVLTEELGLDPDPHLQELERSILNHDPALAGPQAGGVAGAPTPATAATAAVVPRAAAERKPVSVLLLRVDPDAGREGRDPEDVDELSRSLTALVRHEVERRGGTLHHVVGSVWMVLFGIPRTQVDDAHMAVQAAVAIRDRIAARAVTVPGFGSLTTQVAVTTGEALVTYADGDADRVAEVSGEALAWCQQLLTWARPGEVRACDTTRQVAGCEFGYEATTQPGSWSVVTVPAACTSHTSTPFVERDREMQLLCVLFDDARRRGRPHLVTLLGESGIGKSRLVLELGRVVADPQHVPFRYLVGQTRHSSDAPLEPIAEIIRQYATIRPRDERDAAERKLEAAVRTMLPPGDGGASALRDLRDLLFTPEAAVADGVRDRVVATCRQLFEEIAADGGLAIVIEDIHRADDLLLDFLEGLVEESRPVPLVVLATARPELQDRRPHWGGGKRNASTVTLEPLSSAAASGLLTSLLDHHGLRHLMRSDQVGESRISGNPLFAQEYVRMLREGVSLRRRLETPARAGADPGHGDDRVVSLPQSVYTIVAARLDRLPRAEKTVLQVAALLDDPVSASSIAVVAECDPVEAQRCLENLERNGFLRRASGPGALAGQEYCFADVLVRDVAYAQVPRAVRARHAGRAGSDLLRRS
ncbi:BTAD domain-containing putative transcriptional regulator [Micromonospora sp. WMMD980]|uniref:BTAD domain-containing putative transcriptional regulator n=1 Tax=Micromonospora sp. WMMD980 TaxID=3016088 RepID=UPI002416555B|nr:BTAD domain-containing putative transcriptional regulator [Micromonospora sp. WMMD980]MDG4800227.1 BTAD domain-containing putative transcriptional regulator [Micromonospora sp. WMMD980]